MHDEQATMSPAANPAEVEEDESLDEALPPRPLSQPAAEATRSHRTRLARALEGLGFSAEGAEAISRSVEAPNDAADLLRAPSTIGVHGGSLQYITCRVRNGTVLPLPFNPRVSGRVRYPAGGRAGGVEPLRVDASATGGPEISVAASSEPALRSVMRDAEDTIRSINDLRESVASQGVLLPITIVGATFATNTGGVAHVSACSVDGSSRLTAAMSTWDITSEDVLFELADGRAYRTKVSSVRALADRDARDLTDEEQAALRNQSFPAQIIVGYEVLDEGLNFADLLDAYLGLLHVEPPQPWGDAAEQDARAEAVLDELARLERLPGRERDYFAGMLSPQKAIDEGLDPELDGRAAAIFQVIDRRANANAINRALRRLGMKRPAREDRLGVATELSIRPYRLDVSHDAVRRGPRLSLPQAMLGLRADGWSKSDMTPESLRDAALAELDSGGAPGPNAFELSARAAFWLTRFNALQKSSRTDTRLADALVLDISRSRRGIHQLYQSVVDGRSGVHPRRVREDGTVEVPVSGADPAVEDSWLRQTFPAPAGAATPTTSGAGVADPEQQLTDQFYAARREADGLKSRIDSLTDIRDADDQPLVDEVGCPADVAAEIQAALQQVRDRLGVLAHIWRQRSG